MAGRSRAGPVSLAATATGRTIERPAPPLRGASFGSRDSGLELLAELDRPAKRGPDGLGQDRPETPRLELVEGRRARAARGRDHVPELGGMEARLLREERRSLERLD